MKPDEVFTPEALAHYRSARSQALVPLPSPGVWLKLSAALCAAAVFAVLALLLWGRATRYAVVSGTVGPCCTGGEAELRLSLGPTLALAPGQAGQWLVAGEQSARRGLRVVAIGPPDGSGASTLRVRLDDSGACMQRGACLEGSRLELEVEVGHQALLDLLRSPDPPP